MDNDALDADYLRAGFGGHLRPGPRPAVVLVDMVNAYLDPSSSLYAGVEDTLEPASHVLEAARAASVPVVFTRVSYGAGGLDGGTFFKKVAALSLFVGDTHAGAIVDVLTPRLDEIVLTKQYASAFFGTSLASTLTALHIDTVIVMGYSTSGCVRATAVDACQHGFIPLVVSDATGDRDPAPHKANLFDLAAKYAEVIDAVQAVDYLRGL